MRVRIATRNSPLALYQARTVAQALESAIDELDTELVPVTSLGDTDRTSPLSAMGAAGVFTKSLEEALVDGSADLAVHSAKDLPTALDSRFALAAFVEREDPRDALVAGAPVDELKAGALVATGSPRRRAQLAFYRPDFTFCGLRGNIATRLAARERADAVVVGAVALDRLGIDASSVAPDVIDRLDTSVFLPAQGQGAIAVETIADSKIRDLVEEIDHPMTRAAVSAERACVNAIGGGCSAPVAAHASADANRLHLRAAVYSLDGHRVIAGECIVEEPVSDGAALGRDLVGRGALGLLGAATGVLRG